MGGMIKAGVILGVLVEIWTAVVIGAGWHKDPAMLMMFFLVIPLQITVIVMALKGTAAESPYMRQLVNGLVLSGVAGAVVFVGSYLLTTVVFPHYFDEIRVAGAELLAKAGKNPAEVAAEMKKNESMYDPIQNSLTGFIGTEITGLVVSAVAAIFLRKK
ncbi:MAG TPA: DUF4199 domain-containing protein [Candidatus Eisenbacteria bacterium]|nr:DUF4199 domain-containing protein [Candidatus Eisenbacteria bacterium]